MVLWQLWSEILLDWSLTKRYWFDTLAGLLASVLFFYSMVLGLENLTPEGLASLPTEIPVNPFAASSWSSPPSAWWWAPSSPSPIPSSPRPP